MALLLQSAVAADLRDGLVALGKGDLPAARQHLEAAAKQEPANAIVWASLAQTYLRSEQKDLALKAAAEAERLAPNEPAIQHALAMFYSRTGSPAKAAELEQKYATSAAADSDAMARSASLYLQAGDANHAIEAAQAALKRNDTPGVHNMLGKAYALSGKSDQALSELREAARLAPDEEEFAFDVAQTLMRTEKFAEAVQVLEAASPKFASSAQISLALGVAYYGLRRFPEAIQSFLKTIELAPEVPQPYAFLGRILDQAGDKMPDILGKFEQLRSREPDSYLGHLLVAKALLITGDTPERVEPLLRQSIANRGDVWESHAELGDVLSRKRDYPGAAAELEQAAKLNPSEPSIHFRLARVYDRLNAPEKAEAERALHQKLTAKDKSGMSAPKP